MCAAGYASPMPAVDGLRMLESDSDARRRERKQWTADLLDLEAGRIGVPVLDRDAIRAVLASSPKPRIAIVGASPSPVKPSHGVLVDLRGLGYDVKDRGRIPSDLLAAYETRTQAPGKTSDEQPKAKRSPKKTTDDNAEANGNVVEFRSA